MWIEWRQCWCECKELNDSGSCINDYIWNSRTWDFGCNKSCKTDEYSNTKTHSCKKRLIAKLALACKDEIFDQTGTILKE